MLPEQIVAEIEKSPIFAEMTEKFNDFVNEANRRNEIISSEMRLKMEEIRMLVVIKSDPHIFGMYSDYLWQQSNS